MSTHALAAEPPGRFRAPAASDGGLTSGLPAALP
eukprot:CAMPEP_0179146740 /NCGR_PEP_ID=MMETSP0796-20121207/70885_1 /TAXON_ID=73915 /ORGANISM="Pyrodinium bahamense, Strain pbaha01" /LENGTH=33 /DNA_ID= /DNA_START= /DNA_END= /DNA_ORIENTATION=